MRDARFLAILLITVALPACGTLYGRSDRAAVAIRDHVTPFQKWGTRAFTLPQLAWSYDRTCYFTASSENDQHEAFVKALTEVLKRYRSVDLFLLAHSNSYHRWVAEIDPELRKHLRLVYNTGCYDAQQADTWRELGAATYVAHPDNSESPVFYVFFLSHWLWGCDARWATDAANGHAECVLDTARIFGIKGIDDRTAYRSRAVLFGNPRSSMFGKTTPADRPAWPTTTMPDTIE